MKHKRCLNFNNFEGFKTFHNQRNFQAKPQADFEQKDSEGEIILLPN